MTINQALTYFEGLLSETAFIDNPRREARIFIQQALGLEDHLFILEKDQGELDGECLKTVSAWVERRLTGESVAALTGKAYFYGLDFLVNEHVLIPRPETELLLEQVLAFTSHLSRLKALDIGTGSGCIPIVLIKEHPGISFDALDISQSALDTARANRERHGITPDRLTFLQGDFFHFQPEGTYDVIISNPPYIKSAVVDEIVQNKQAFDPRLALDGGEDGLDFYRKIKEFIHQYLSPGGFLFLEHGFDQKEALTALFAAPGYELYSYRDYAGLDRILCIRRIKG